MKIKWGILGPGNVAHSFAESLTALPEAELWAVGSRSLERANEFADKFNIKKRYGSYQDLVEDPELDVVYIASPHSVHKENTLLCLEAGKAVLCEKPLAVSYIEAKEMVDKARAQKLFLMEAMWSRFLPVIVKLRKLLVKKVVGEIKFLDIKFGFRTEWDPEDRLLNPDLAGGALLDAGIYPLSFASMILGAEPVAVRSLADIGSTEVDEQTSIILKYKGGQLANLACSVRSNIETGARITGTKGSIYVPEFLWGNSLELNIFEKEGIEEINLPFESKGYNYQAQEVMDCLKAGKLESDIMPLDESLKIFKIMDQIRDEIGLKYPFES
ncbi:MAG: Gfo/Idh/MocA family protein [Halanaerobiaceae bacterium]